ncbi:hypothetical protein AB834_01290 [PVC group bacterium (ex Bugula neritina AB1)]|nr:hypothetical protein AB834_01290 [PVC group bacterium (ex Bugula neritina AB1)]
MLKVLLTREVAEMLRISEEHVRDLIRQGKLNAYKEGRRGGYRITIEEVERYVNERFKELSTPKKEAAADLEKETV